MTISTIQRGQASRIDVLSPGNIHAVEAQALRKEFPGGDILGAAVAVAAFGLVTQALALLALRGRVQ